MLTRMIAPLLLAIAANGHVAAQNPWSAAAGTSTSSLHSGSSGGPHEFVEVSNSLNPPLPTDTVTMTVVYFEKKENGEVIEKTVNITIPAGQTRSFQGDVKSVVVTAGSQDASGTYSVRS